MHSIFKLQDGGFIPLEQGLPAGYRGIILRGAESFSFQNSSEMIILQNFQRTDFAIKFGIYKFLRIVKSILDPPIFSTGITIALKQDFHFGFKGQRHFRLKTDHFSFIHYAGQQLLAEFKEGNEYRILDISYSDEIMYDTLHHFPELSDQFEIAMQQQYASIITSQRFASQPVKRLVNHLLHSPYQPIVNEIYFEYKIRESLILFLAENSKKKEPEISFTNKEEQMILHLKKRMELDPAAKFPIPELARELGMNTMKLKILFKKLVGWTIFQFHLEQRMNEALRLLKDSNLSIKVVAGMVGYKRATSFVTQFRLFFGFPPSNIQNKEK